MHAFRTVLAAGALALAASCAGTPDTAGVDSISVPFATALPAAPEGRCAATTRVAWPAAGDGIALVGHASGNRCDRVQVTAFVVDRENNVLFQVTERGSDLRLVFGEAADPVPTDKASMAAALENWLTQRNDTSASLPAWRTEDAAFTAEEFPFLIDESLGQAAYEALRAANLPLLRLVQGSESEAVYVLTREGQMVEIGLQMFPG